jgi:hypothetical protein
MNERMLKLYLQALDVNYIPVPVEDHIPLSVEKFAELIVQECAEIVEETRWMVPPSQEQIARSIKQHFGVKE